MKKTNPKSHTPRAGLHQMDAVNRVEHARAVVERLEQQRIDFEHRARAVHQNLFAPRRGDASGWIDAKR
jgi:hypothetical protein